MSMLFSIQLCWSRLMTLPYWYLSVTFGLNILKCSNSIILWSALSLRMTSHIHLVTLLRAKQFGILFEVWHSGHSIGTHDIFRLFLSSTDFTPTYIFLCKTIISSNAYNHTLLTLIVHNGKEPTHSPLQTSWFLDNKITSGSTPGNQCTPYF